MPATPPEMAAREDQSLLVAVAPVRPGRGFPLPLRVIGVAVIVGAIGFLAGNRVGGGSATGVPADAPLPTPSSSLPAPSPAVPAPSPATAASPESWRGLSSFAYSFAFRPERLIAALPGGIACATRSGAVPGHTGAGDGRSLVVVWLSTCPIQPTGRAPFLARLLAALEREIPSWRANTSRDDHGISVTDFGYTQGGSTGNVTVVADSAGPDLVISITLEEPVAP